MTSDSIHAIIKVFPQGERSLVRRKRKLRTVYPIMQTTSYDTLLYEIYDTRAKAEAAISAQKIPEDFYIVPRKLK